MISVKHSTYRRIGNSLSDGFLPLNVSNFRRNSINSPTEYIQNANERRQAGIGGRGRRRQKRRASELNEISENTSRRKEAERGACRKAECEREQDKIHKQLDIGIDGWTDRWMDGWPDRQTDRRIDRQTDGWMDGQTDNQTGEQIARRTVRQIDRQRDMQS